MSLSGDAALPAHPKDDEVFHRWEEARAVLFEELSAPRHLVLVPVYPLSHADRGAPFGFTPQEEVIGLHVEFYFRPAFTLALLEE